GTVVEMGREFESAKKFDTVRKMKSIAAEKTLLLKKEQEEVQPRLEALIPLFENGEYKQAVERARSIIEDNPKVMYAYHILGSAYKQLGQKDEARQAFEYIVRTATDYDDALEFADGAHFHLGTMCLAEEQLLEALEHFKICMHLNPSHQKAREFYWLLIENETHSSELVGSDSIA
ncbi:MAG: tetratricopeptide repeat protein, partial [Nitrospinales bacterium]